MVQEKVSLITRSVFVTNFLFLFVTIAFQIDFNNLLHVITSFRPTTFILIASPVNLNATISGRTVFSLSWL